MDEQERGLGLSLRFDPETRTLKADIELEARSGTIDETWLQARLAEEGWVALKQSPRALEDLVAHYNQGLALEALQLAECVDARIEISISPDGLEASLDIEPAQGGEPANEEAILQTLRNKGVTEGYLLEAIKSAANSNEARGLVVARGRAAIAGEDGWLECLLPEVRSRVPRIDELGHADYRDLGEIQTVHPGDALMLRHPPSEGVSGVTVLGLPIPARSGKDAKFGQKLEGTELSPDNANLLVATITGQPVKISDGVSVEPVFSVGSVNAASGNIRFDGSVQIQGDVLAGMRVQATGDIEVEGVVEAATLEAGGNIVIKGGAMGDLGHKGSHFMRCGGSFSAAYASLARIEAGDSIFIDDAAMQCELIAVNSIRVGKTRRGQLLGGHAQATFSICARVVGAPNRVRTLLEIGVNPILHTKLQDLIRNREAREHQIFEISKVLDLARKLPEKFPPEALEKLRNTAAQLASEIEEIRTEQNELEQKIELSRQSRVIAEQALHEGVEVFLSGRHYQVSGEHGPTAIGLNGEGLGLLPLEGYTEG